MDSNTADYRMNHTFGTVGTPNEVGSEWHERRHIVHELNTKCKIDSSLLNRLDDASLFSLLIQTVVRKFATTPNIMKTLSHLNRKLQAMICARVINPLPVQVPEVFTSQVASTAYEIASLTSRATTIIGDTHVDAMTRAEMVAYCYLINVGFAFFLKLSYEVNKDPEEGAKAFCKLLNSTDM